MKLGYPIYRIIVGKSELELYIDCVPKFVYRSFLVEQVAQNAYVSSPQIQSPSLG